MESIERVNRDERFEEDQNRGYGQRPHTNVKYAKAIEDCKSLEYIHYTLSDIARWHQLQPTGLNNQLKAHFPEIIIWRTIERMKRGITKFNPNGARNVTEQQYAKALRMLRKTEQTKMQDKANENHVSYSETSQSVLFYHTDGVKSGRDQKNSYLHLTKYGDRNGSHAVHKPRVQTVRKYAKALELYIHTALTLEQVAKKTHVSVNGLYNYIRLWHRDVIAQRRGLQIDDPNAVNFNEYKRYLKSTREKYIPAIARMKESNLSTSAVAKEFGLNPETFRAYIKTHEPSLYNSNGMMESEKGSRMSRKSYGKYKEAIEYYASTNCSLKEVSDKYGLVYISFRSFIIRHYPELMERD